MNLFARATRAQVPLKIGITGPSGSGKTTAALRLTRGLVGPDAPIAFLDTEQGSASLYSHLTAFDVLNMNPPYQVAKFVQAIANAVEAGYKALIIDSGSAEWQELLAEKEALDSRGGNSFANWGSITKKHEDFLKAIRNAPIHLIVCLRAKQEHVQDKDANGRTTIRKVGMAAVQRDGMEYELTTVFDIAMDHNAKASKDRTGLFDGRIEPVVESTGKELAAWLIGGAVLTPQSIGLAKPAESLEQIAQNIAQAQKENPAPVSTEAAAFADAVAAGPAPTITTEQFGHISEACTAHQVDIPALTAYCASKDRLAGDTLRTLYAEHYAVLLASLKDTRRRATLVKSITPTAA